MFKQRYKISNFVLRLNGPPTTVYPQLMVPAWPVARLLTIQMYLQPNGCWITTCRIHLLFKNNIRNR